MNKPLPAKKPPMRWGVERRMEFIEFRLLWEGGINRSDLVEQFGVSAPQASNDLSQYKESAPDNIIYDLSEKRYFASEKFRPLFLKPDANQYLSQLKLIADHVVSAEDTWLSAFPITDSIPIPQRRTDIKILKPLIDAVRNRRSLEVHYHSMNKKRPDPIWRWISPHAFAHDGLRWHIRAFCHMENRFKDFILSRFLETKSFGAPAALPEQDKCWKEFIDVVLIPNPELSKEQKQGIVLDYGMEENKLCIPVRKALLYYFQKRFGLDLNILKGAYESSLMIKNRKEFDKAFAEANPGFSNN